MTKRIQLPAEARERAGKGAARQLRRAHKVPAVIYGDKKDPVNIALPKKEVTTEYFKGHFFTNLTEVQIGNDTYLCLARDVQVDPVKDYLIHVDFLRVTPRTRITVNVPVNFYNEEECEGIEDEGGILNIVRHEVEIYCRATDIPEQIDVDLNGFTIGDSINISDAALPDGVEPSVTDRDFTLATIAAPRSLVEEEEEELEEGEEGEEAEGEEEAGEDSAEGEESSAGDSDNENS